MTDATSLLMQAKYGNAESLPLLEDTIPDLTPEDFVGKSVTEVWAMKLVESARKAEISRINRDRQRFLTSSVDDKEVRLAT